MQTEPMPSTPVRVPASILAWSLLSLALLPMISLLGNELVQDDQGIITLNPSIHHWGGILKAFSVPYWPPVTSGELWRPLSSALFTVEWMVGGGAVWPFRVFTLVLYAGATLMVWRLLRALLPDGAAWFGAAIFAVHPVHVEAVAVAVNQSELIVAILLAWATHRYVRAARNEVPYRSMVGGVLAAFVAAIFTKEHGLVLPGLLVAADLLLTPDLRAAGARIRRALPLFGAMVVVAAVYWTLRTRVLGPGAGTDPAEALFGADLGQRALTMAGIPAEWLRLFLWPAHLQVDWSMLEWIPARGWTLRETTGLIALASVTLAFVLAFRRRPVVAFGLAWMAIALAPVSNVLIPSGVILAERTLFLATVGLAIVVADLVRPVFDRWATLGRPARLGALALAATILGLGASRSAARFVVWRDRPMFLASLVTDAPLSWKAHLTLGLLLVDMGDTTNARASIRRAVELRPDHLLATRPIADRNRIEKGACKAPAMVYEEILRVAPRRNDIRASLLACQIFLGEYATASAGAAEAASGGTDVEFFDRIRTVADSAARVSARPGTVRLPTSRNRETIVGPTGP